MAIEILMKVLIENIETEFKQAHREICDAFQYTMMFNGNVSDYLEKTWWAWHNVKLHRGESNNWESLEFTSSHHYLLWRLKYS